MALQASQILNNRYRIDKLLGQGGFGAVYKAWDLNMECPCAVKENLDTSQEAIKQFKREASILHKLRHPNLPLVYDHFIIPDQGQYLVMDYVEGEDMQQMLDRLGGPITEHQVLIWIQQVCDALSYLHSQKPPIIHRDIKPANIKITPEGKAMLVDFGIAKVFDPVLSTTVGARAITPGYSPHEQYGHGKTDSRTDIYALGATLYTLLTGQVPVESIQRMIKDSLVPPEELNPTISPTVAKAIRQAMENDPERRPPTTDELKNTLKTIPLLDSMEIVSEPKPTHLVQKERADREGYERKISKFESRPILKWLPWIAGLIVLILLSFVLWLEKPLPDRETHNETAIAMIAPTETPSPLPTQTPLYTQTPTLAGDNEAGETLAICTPPACNSSEIYYCQDECPGGCGLVCATQTPTITEPIPKVLASRPTNNELLNIKSITSGLYGDYLYPGEYTYETSVPAGESRIWDLVWGAKTVAELKEMISAVSMTFLVDDVPLSNNTIYEYEQDCKSWVGWYCHYWVVKLTNWQPDTSIKLEVYYKLVSSIFDGQSNYAPGEYKLIIYVNTR